jgi:hypothetical protein
MTRLAALLMMLSGAFVVGCGPGGGGSDNPAQLWLSLDGDELHAKLIAKQPPHY